VAAAAAAVAVADAIVTTTVAGIIATKYGYGP